MLGVAVSDAAVDPVGSDHEVVAVPSGKFGAEFRFVMKDDSEFLGTVAKDVEQHLPADADKAVARRTIDLAAVMDLNVVPVREAISNRPRADRVVRLQVDRKSTRLNSSH